MKKIIYLSCALAVISSCRSTGYVSLKYPTAPVVSLPANIHNIVLVNRSAAKPGDKKNSVIESIATGEIAGSDKLASDECLKGVYDGINGWKEFNVLIPPDNHLYGTGTREMPPLLNWAFVKKTCEGNKSDALLVLETFDSNSDIISKAVTDGINSVLSGHPTTPAPPTQIRMNVISSWRMYDPYSEKIIDEFTSNSKLVFDANGQGIALPPPDALSRTAYDAGKLYIERLLPGYFYVKRNMYRTGRGSEKQKFKTAFRHSEVADWQASLDLWMELAKSQKRVNAGRACLNIAVAYEVLGNNEQALTWAKKSYEEYGNKWGRDYANELKYRISIE